MRKSHRPPPHAKPGMEMSPEKAELFRPQITQETWRYAAQGRLKNKIKSVVQRLLDLETARPSLGAFAKCVLSIGICCGLALIAWRIDILRHQLAASNESRLGDFAAQRPRDGGRPGIADDHGDLPPPIVPDELGMNPPGNLTPTTPNTPDPSAEETLDAGREPWADVLAATGEPPPFDEVCYDDFPPEQAALKPQDLRRWLATEQGAGAGIQRLRAPWPTGAALRLALKPQDGFRIHLFSGEQAVTLGYFGNAQPPGWFAFAAADKPRPPQHKLAALIGSDGGRFQRTGTAAFALHHHDGRLTMTRGPVVLMSVPLPEAPTAVYFEGNAEWRGVTLARSGPPTDDGATRPVVLRADKPAKLAWSQPNGAKLQRPEDGSIQLVGPFGATAESTIRVPERGLHEVIVQVGVAKPGTGIFLGDAAGRPIHRLGFFTDPGTKQTVAEYSPPGEQRDTAAASQLPPALVRDGQWFRLVLGIGTFKAWTSPDGRHWARLPQPPPRGVPLGYATVGMYALHRNAERSIALRHVEVRELSAITSLASVEARENARPIDSQPIAAAWLQRVAEQQPPGSDSAEWRRACAIRTLSSSPPVALAAALLEALVREEVARPAMNVPRGQRDPQLELLAEAGLLWDTWDTAEPLLQHYDRLAEAWQRAERPREEPDRAGQDRGAQDGTASPVERMLTALAQAEIACPAQCEILREKVVAAEVLQQVSHGDWPRLLEARQQLEFWRRQLPPQNSAAAWLAWGSYLARQAPGARKTKPAIIGAPVAEDRLPGAFRRPFRPRISDAERNETAKLKSWRHPLVEQINKDGFNLISEFEAALQGESFEDACQTAMTADPQAALGLLPWSKDPQLTVSFPTAVALAMQTHAGMQQTMREKFAAPGVIRVRQAKLTGDVATLRAATVHLVDTPAAAEAHQYLGDRALAAGEFERALAHYQRAEAQASAESRQHLAGLVRLAGAMIGRDIGQRPDGAVEFAGARLEPADFEKLVADLLAQHRGQGSPAQPKKVAATTLPPPSRFDASPWGLGVVAPGSVVSTASDGDTLYIGTQSSLQAINFSDGKPKWPLHGVALANPAQGGVGCPLTMSRGRLYARRLAGPGSIVCVDTANGQNVWTAGPQFAEPGEQLISDPLVVGDQVYGFTTLRQPGATLDVRLLVFDAATGRLVRQHALIRLNDLWQAMGYVPCGAVAWNDRLLAAVGGCVLCCDLAGQPLWVRKQTRLPESLPLQREAASRHTEPPLIVGDRAYVTQRDVRAVECLDLLTGKLHWRHAALDVRRLVAAADQMVVVETDDGLIGLDAATGEVRWQRELLASRTAGQLATAHLHDAKQLLVAYTTFHRRDTFTPIGRRASSVLGWFDLQTGRDLAQFPILAGPDQEITAIVRRDQRLFAATKGAVLELKPRGKIEPSPAEAAELAPWIPLTKKPEAVSRAEEVQRNEAASQLGWVLLDSHLTPQTGWHETWQKEKDIVLTAASPAEPLRMLRRVAVPAQGPAKMSLQVGHEPNEQFELEITASGKALFKGEVSAKTAKDQWLKQELDLSPFAGKTIWLSATARALDGKLAHQAWRAIAEK